MEDEKIHYDAGACVEWLTALTMIFFLGAVIISTAILFAQPWIWLINWIFNCNIPTI